MSVIKQKKCRHCKAEFFPARPLQIACSINCSMSIARIKRAKSDRSAALQERRATKQALLLIKPRSQLLKEAQTAFNAFVRARDALLPCISCGRHHDGQYHAGHYLSTGARPELRFNEHNCHKQCQPCNTHLHGNLILYRVALIKKVGIEEVERLEGPHEPAKWARDALIEIRRYFLAKVKAIK